MPRIAASVLAFTLAPAAALAMRPMSTTLPPLEDSAGYCTGSPEFDCAMMMCPAVLPNCAPNQCAYRTGCCSSYQCVNFADAAAGNFPGNDKSTTTDAPSGQGNGYCLSSPMFKCGVQCPQTLVAEEPCADDECTYRTGCCTTKCLSLADDMLMASSSTPNVPATTKVVTQTDRIVSTPQQTNSKGTTKGVMTTDRVISTVRDSTRQLYTTAAKLPYAESDGFCNTSPPLMCKMACPDAPSCGKTQCAMRANSCTCKAECVAADNTQATSAYSELGFLAFFLRHRARHANRARLRRGCCCCAASADRLNRKHGAGGLVAAPISLLVLLLISALSVCHVSKYQTLLASGGRALTPTPSWTTQPRW
jgi:hypothetical protein